MVSTFMQGAVVSTYRERDTPLGRVGEVVEADVVRVGEGAHDALRLAAEVAQQSHLRQGAPW